MWTLYCLSRTPEAQDALYQEVCEVLPEDGVVTLDTLNNIPYVKACLKETFRSVKHIYSIISSQKTSTVQKSETINIYINHK